MHPLDNDGLMWRRLQEVRSLRNGQRQTAAHRTLQQGDASQFDTHNVKLKLYPKNISKIDFDFTFINPVFSTVFYSQICWVFLNG